MPIIESQLEQLMDAATAVEGDLTYTEALLRATGSAVAAEFAATAPEDAVVGAAIVGGIIEAFGGWIVTLVIIFVIIALLVLLAALTGALDRIPWKGHAAAQVLRGWFGFLYSWKAWVVKHFVEYASDLIAWIAQFIAYVAATNVAHRAAAGNAPRATPANMATTADINHLQTEINAILYMIGHPANASATQDIIAHVPATIVQQLHAVENSVVTLRKDMTLLYNRVDRIISEQTQMASQVAQLTHSLHAVRAVAVGWQDVAESEAQLARQVTSLANSVLPELHQQARTIAMLMPLTLLLAPGLPGLRNLRKLEDDPCQCPKVGNVGNELGTMLAMYEFVTNG